MPFFTFNQNNSGGRYHINEKLAKVVIIEADHDAAANEFAESIGIYFDGIDKGQDCPCCGDRWSQASERDGRPEPRIYEETIEEYLQDRWAISRKHTVHLYHADGRHEVFRAVE